MRTAAAVDEPWRFGFGIQPDMPVLPVMVFSAEARAKNFGVITESYCELAGMDPNIYRTIDVNL